jgi:hypothetical protein
MCPHTWYFVDCPCEYAGNFLISLHHCISIVAYVCSVPM